MNIRKAVDYSTMFATLESVMKADLPQMELYCEIGKAVCAHSEKGAAVAAAEFIKEQYPDMTGFSPRNVRRMRDFWQLYSGTPELLGEALHLNWTQNVVIMEAELPAEERRWHIRQATARNLSKSELLQMIEDFAHPESVLDEKVDAWYNEDNDNNNLTIPQVVNRLGMVFFLLFFNLGITIFVFLLTGMMLFSQILFIIFAMFLPISFLLSMIPSYEAWQSRQS